MRRLVLIGAGGQCRASVELAESVGCYDEIIIVDHKADATTNERILGREVVNYLDWTKQQQPMSEYFISIGCGVERARLFGLLKERGMEIASLCHNSAVVHESAVIGKGVFIGALAHVGPGCNIADGCIINTMSNIEHESIVGAFSHCAPGSVMCGRSSIGKQVMLGTRATIIENISVADNVVVGAGAVVIRDIIESGSVNIGIPSKRI